EYRYLYLNPTLRGGGVGSEPCLKEFTERHKLQIRIPTIEAIDDPISAMTRGEAHGIVFAMSGGLPDAEQLRIADYVLSRRHRVWFYWLGESAVECIDRERLRSYRQHVCLATIWESLRPSARIGLGAVQLVLRLRSGKEERHVLKRCGDELDHVIATAR